MMKNCDFFKQDMSNKQRDDDCIEIFDYQVTDFYVTAVHATARSCIDIIVCWYSWERMNGK